MPTPIRAEGFEHRTVNTTFFQANGAGIFDAVSRSAGVTIDTTNKRTGVASLKVVEDGATATYAEVGFAGTQRLVGSVYVRLEADPSVGSRILTSVGGTDIHSIKVTTAGLAQADLAAGTPASGPDIVDGAWHRIDFEFLSNGTTYTINWAVDGAAQTQVTSTGQTAQNMTDLRLGSTTASHTATCWYDDLVLSVTSGDHPIGGHKVLAMHVNGDGTHEPNITAGDFDKADGTDILTTTTDAWTEIDDWITGTADTTTYVQDTAGASTEYTEHTFADTTEGTIWGVHGYAAVFASLTTACRLTVRIVDSGGATVADIINDADVSETTLIYRSAFVVANPTQAVLNGYKVRIGLSTDVAPDPRCSAVMLQYAVPASDTQTVTGVTLDVTPDFPVAALRHQVGAVTLDITPDQPAATLQHRLTAVTLEIVPDFPAATLRHELAGATLDVAPDFPVASLRLEVLAVTLDVTPDFPAGSVTSGQTITGVTLDVTPDLPAALLRHQLAAVTLDITPDFPAATLRHQLAAVTLDVAPDMPVAALRHLLAAVTLDAAPDFPAGTITSGQTVTGVTLEIVPDFPAGALQVRLAALTLDVTPDQPAATLRHSLAAVTLDITPDMPAAALLLRLAGALLDITPDFPIASITGGEPANLGPGPYVGTIRRGPGTGTIRRGPGTGTIRRGPGTGTVSEL